MKIGIDISQIAYPGTGVANYTKNLVAHLLEIDKKNEYLLFYSSLRNKFLISNFEFLNKSQFQNHNFKIMTFRLPPTLLDFLWNRLHVLPIERLIGDIDVFITSDWTEPPATKARKVTVLYDLIIYKHPEETAKIIVGTQKRKLAWVKKESQLVICISEATKKDAVAILGISERKLKVIYPGGVGEI